MSFPSGKLVRSATLPKIHTVYFLMAIFHCHSSSIGKSSSPTGTASASIDYEMREGNYKSLKDLEYKEVYHADSGIKSPQQFRDFVDQYEKTSRKNARILEKIEVALPIEFKKDEQIEVVRNYLKNLSGDKLTNWSFAIHSDNKNPHCHISFVAIDSSSKRILDISSGRNSTEKHREIWSNTVNSFAKEQGYNFTIDHRSYIDQGIDKTPTRHVGWKDGKRRDDVIEYNHKVSKLNEVDRDKLNTEIDDLTVRILEFETHITQTKALLDEQKKELDERTGQPTRRTGQRYQHGFRQEGRGFQGGVESVIGTAGNTRAEPEHPKRGLDEISKRSDEPQNNDERVRPKNIKFGNLDDRTKNRYKRSKEPTATRANQTENIVPSVVFDAPSDTSRGRDVVFDKKHSEGLGCVGSTIEHNHKLERIETESNRARESDFGIEKIERRAKPTTPTENENEIKKAKKELVDEAVFAATSKSKNEAETDKDLKEDVREGIGLTKNLVNYTKSVTELGQKVEEVFGPLKNIDFNAWKEMKEKVKNLTIDQKEAIYHGGVDALEKMGLGALKPLFEALQKVKEVEQVAERIDKRGERER